MTTKLKVTTGEVLAFLEADKGGMYACGVLADRWGINVMRMKRLLENLMHKGLVSAAEASSRPRRSRLYYVPQEGTKTTANAASKSTFKQGPEWDAVRARLVEFRKIKSIG